MESAGPFHFEIPKSFLKSKIEKAASITNRHILRSKVKMPQLYKTRIRKEIHILRDSVRGRQTHPLLQTLSHR